MHLENIEDFYPLAPAQQGILFHALHDPTPSYFGQLAFTFFEGFNEQAFEHAWRQLINRHAILRSFFVWDGLKDPVQVVRRAFDLPLDRMDWRNLPREEHERELARFLKADRAKGLDLGSAPVMRLTLIRLDEDRFRFVWSHHHILLDGWSVPLLLDDFFTLYAAGAGASELELPVRRPYRDYIAWLAKQDPLAAEAYWRKLFQKFDSPFALRDFLPRLGNSQIGAREEETKLKPELFDRLRDVARSHRVTLNTLVQAAWAIVLNRYTGISDLVYGTTVSGRPPDLDGSGEIIGLFINTLPMRVAVCDSMPLAELLQAIQSQQADTRQFEYSRLVDVQTWSGATRGAALFDSIFVFENYPVSVTAGSGESTVKAGELSFDQTTNYAVTLAVTMGKTLTLRCLYDPARVSAHGASTLLRSLHRALESMAAHPRPLVGALESVAPSERMFVCEESSETIPNLFAVQAAAFADHLAVVGEKETLTFRDLDERSNRLAHYLRHQGAGPEETVPVCLDRGPEFITAIVGILKAGAAYLPLDSSLPQARLHYMLEHSGARVAVTSSVHSDRFSASGVSMVCLDLDRARIAAFPATNLSNVVHPSNLAYIVYTSGSTGRPKGVMVQHASLVNLVQSQIRAFEIDENSRILQFASASFDASVSEIFCALLSGAALHLAGPLAQSSSEEIVRLLKDREISVLTLPPSLLAVLPPADLPHLRTLVAAGEHCPPAVVARWSAGRRFLNAYGPTETTVCASISEPLSPGSSIDIGMPITNTGVYVLDKGLRPVETNLSGELYIAGAPLARGYRAQPELTAERFLPDPFSGRPGDRMYRTGDRARQLDNGHIEYLGRIDFQVKLRGFRIELGEVESRLEAVSTISRASVIIREDQPGDPRLVAYVTPAGETKPEPRDLLAEVRSHLPDYMVPAAIVILDALPLTSSGKVDRRALPAPDVSRSSAASNFVPPSNDAERTIAAIWSEVLHLKAVGVHDNFFDLGGHSLLLMQVHGKLKQAFPKEISMIQMFGYPTVAKLAEFFTRTEPQQPARAFAGIHERVARKREAMKRAAGQEAP